MFKNNERYQITDPRILGKHTQAEYKRESPGNIIFKYGTTKNKGKLLKIARNLKKDTFYTEEK